MRSLLRCLVIAASSLALLAPADASARRAAPFGSLVADGRPQATIVVPSDAGLVLRFAARELRRYVHAMTGTHLAIVEGSVPVRGKAVVLAANPSTNRRVPPVDADAFSIVSGARRLSIAGATERATLFGVYALLERLGCRWLAPGVDYVPRKRALSVPRLRVGERPAFRWRGLELIAGSTPAVVDWMAKVRLNVAWPEQYQPLNDLRASEASMRATAVPEMLERGLTVFWGGHVLPTLVAPDRYAHHPEYYAELGGKRLDPQTAFQERTQLCTGNPSAMRTLADNTQEFLRNHPWIDVFFLWGNDTTRWCECAGCRMIEPQPDLASPFGGLNRSATYCRMVRIISESVQSALPGRRIGFNHYYNLEEVPHDAHGRPLRSILPPGDATISAVDAYRQCDRHPFTDTSCPGGKRIAPVARAWRPFYRETVSWSYYWSMNFMKGLPISMARKIPADFRHLRSLGINGVIDNVSVAPGSVQWLCNDLNLYLHARAAWNPSLDVAAETADYLRHAYGPAAPQMSRFWSLMDGCTRLYARDQSHMPDDAALRDPRHVHGWMRDIRSLIPNQRTYALALGHLRGAASRMAVHQGQPQAGQRSMAAFRIAVLRDVVERWQPPKRAFAVHGFLNGGGDNTNHAYLGDDLTRGVRCSITGGNNRADCFWPTPLGAAQLAGAGDVVEAKVRVNYGSDKAGEVAYRSGPGLYQADKQDTACAAPGTRSTMLFIGNMDDERSGPRRVILMIHDGAYATTVRSSVDNAWEYRQPVSLRIEYVGPSPGGHTYRYLYGDGERWTELATHTFSAPLTFAAPMHYWAGLQNGREARFPLIDWAECSDFAVRKPR